MYRWCRNRGESAGKSDHLYIKPAKTVAMVPDHSASAIKSRPSSQKTAETCTDGVEIGANLPGNQTICT